AAAPGVVGAAGAGGTGRARRAIAAAVLGLGLQGGDEAGIGGQVGHLQEEAVHVPADVAQRALELVYLDALGGIFHGQGQVVVVVEHDLGPVHGVAHAQAVLVDVGPAVVVNGDGEEPGDIEPVFGEAHEEAEAEVVPVVATVPEIAFFADE